MENHPSRNQKWNSICFSFLFLEYDQPHESQTNKDIVETIHRKGLGEGPGEYWDPYVLTYYRVQGTLTEGNAQYS